MARQLPFLADPRSLTEVEVYHLCRLRNCSNIQIFKVQSCLPRLRKIGREAMRRRYVTAWLCPSRNASNPHTVRQRAKGYCYSTAVLDITTAASLAPHTVCYGALKRSRCSSPVSPPDGHSNPFAVIPSQSFPPLR
jgi:hypothetical protein